jgi:CMP-N-acetylneuraminic acid synthetase
MTFPFERALAVVPARGGSKRLPRKNLLDLGGKPLVCHTLDSAVESGCFAEIRLSSDDAEILALADRYPEVDPAPRSPEWASDGATVFEFVRQLVLDAGEDAPFDAIALLLPTVPFRRPETVRAAASALTPEVDAVVTLCRYDFPPQFAVTLDGGDRLLVPVFDPSPLVSGRTRSQDQVPMLHPNGAIFLAWWQSYRLHGSFYRGVVRGHEMSRSESVDIDTSEDLEYARFLLGRSLQNGKYSPA